MTIRSFLQIAASTTVLCLAFMSAVSREALAGERVLGNIEVATLPGGAEIRINFNVPRQYIIHAPAEKGDVLQIKLRPTAADTGSDPIKREVLSWQPSEEVPLEEVIYEGDTPGRVGLTLRFRRSVHFGVRGGSDLRSVVVTLMGTGEQIIPAPPPTDDKIVQEERPQPESAPSQEEPKTVHDDSAAEATDVPLPLVRPPYRYAINLVSSTTSRDPSYLARREVLDKYRLYTTRSEKDGIVWYRTRLGFFPSKEAAEEVLQSLRGTYPNAWVTEVDEQAAARIMESTPEGLKDFKSPEAMAEAKSEEEETPALNQAASTGSRTGETVSRLNLREGPKGTLPVITTLDAGTSLVIEEQIGSWLRVQAGGLKGWVSADYVRMIPPEAPEKTMEQVAQPPADVSTPMAEAIPSPTGPTAETEDGAPTASAETYGGQEALKSISDERVMLLKDEAEVAMTSGDYRRAIQIYTKLLEFPDEETRREAQELLGLARERNGQLAHAKAEYESYLQLYPEGEGAERVRQRLSGLLTARAVPKEKLRKAKEKTGWLKELYGSLSQFYDRNSSSTEITGTTVDISTTTVDRSTLRSDLDVNARLRNDAWDIHTLFIGGYDKDFLDESDDDSRVSALYLDVLDRQRNIDFRVGRQTRSTGGVLGRFDGGFLNYQLFPKMSVNAVGGYPVESSTDNLDTDKHFYGLSFDFGTFANYWDFNTFYIRQEAEGIKDREAVGGELRYFHPNRSVFSLVDYDIYYSELNLFLLTGNVIFPDRTTLNLSVDYRKSPLLTTSNAIIGQNAIPGREGIESVADLLDLGLSEDEVKDLANDRTAESKSVTVGVSRPLNDKFQISADFAASKLTGTDASGGVEAVLETGTDYFYSTQLIGSSLIKEGDIAIVGLRYADTANADTISLNLNTRYPISRSWRFNPRFDVSYRDNKDDDGEQIVFRPSLRMEYVWRKRYHLELEGGAEFSDEKLTDDTQETDSYFWTIGYRVDF